MDTTITTLTANARTSRRMPGTWAGSVLMLLCLLSFASRAQPDLSGYWQGELHDNGERVILGLQLSSDINGRYDMALDLPISHLRSLPMHGKATLENGYLIHNGLHLRLQLTDTRLHGTVLGSNKPVVLHRATQALLPAPSAPDASLPLPGPRWSARLGGQIYASPAVCRDVAYIGTTGGMFSAINTNDGSLRWSSALGHPIFGAALITDDAVFVTSDGGYVHRLERLNGREQWRASIEDTRTSRELPHPASAAWEWQAPRPLLVDNALYVGGGDGSVQALDARTGATLWKVQLPGRIQHGLSINHGILHALTEPGELHAVDARTGRRMWRYALAARPGAAPAVHRGRVFVNDRSGILHAVDARTGRGLWRTQFWTSWIESEPSFDHDTLYVGSSDLRKISAIETTTGRVRWRADVGGWSWGTPLLLDDRLIVGTAAGAPYTLDHQASVSVIDRHSGTLVARYPLPAGHGFQWGIAGSVARSEQTLVAADIEGVLMGFDLNAMIEPRTANITPHIAPMP